MGLLDSAGSLLSGASGLASSAKLLASGAGISGFLTSAKVLFGGPGNSDDWRVRLSLPPNDTFNGSSVLAPLKKAGGLVFPFTPTISIAHSASYEDVGIMHQNYQVLAYQNSKASKIQISGTFVSEDAVSAQYWIAAVHFLRSATKMYTGDSGAQSGSPPPILTLNGYGDYVFKNVPCVITDFSVELPQDVNYISTTISDIGGALGGIADIASAVSAVSGLVGASAVSQAASKVGAVAGMATGLAGKVTSLFGGAGVTHVPVKSTVVVTVQPVYNRESLRQFSLSKFVKGDYVKGNGGFI